MALKPLAVVLCAMALSAPSSAATINHDNFNNFVEGALKVYSKFQEPSKQESEQFYSFLKSKWTSCQPDTCKVEGQRVGEEYAAMNQVKLDNY